MAEYLIQDTSLIDLANSVRTVTGNANTMTPSQMKNALDDFSPKKTVTVTINYSGGYVFGIDNTGTLIEIHEIGSGVYELLGGLLYYYPSDAKISISSAAHNTAIFTDNAMDTVYLLTILEDGGTATITE